MTRTTPMVKFVVLSVVLCLPIGWGCSTVPPAAPIAPAAPAAPIAPAAPAAAPKLVITKAVYGALPDGPSVDVTAQLAGLVKNNTLTVEVSNDILGDPAEGVSKKLRVDYTLDGAAHTRTRGEDEVLNLPTDPKPLVGKLAVVKAVFGDLTTTNVADVTAKVAAMVENNTLTVEATIENFDDPAPGVYKRLRVDYTIDGVPQSKSVGERRTLTITGNASAKPAKKAAKGPPPARAAKGA